MTPQGVSPLQSHVKAISKLDTPTNLKELWRLLGAAVFNRKFVPQFSDFVEPLNELFRGKTEFAGSDQRQQAFDQLKTALTPAAVLAHFDPRLLMQVTTDASAVAIGAVLSQTQPNGYERPVAYASRTLTTAERAYSVFEREALACIWACERWHWFLYCRRFTLRTDHSLLTTLLSGGTKGRRPMQLFRWADRLSEYQFDVVYRPGADNAVADLLSRSEAEPSHKTPPGTATLTDIFILTVFGNAALDGLNLQDVAEATATDAYSA